MDYQKSALEMDEEIPGGCLEEGGETNDSRTHSASEGRF